MAKKPRGEAAGQVLVAVTRASWGRIWNAAALECRRWNRADLIHLYSCIYKEGTASLRSEPHSSNILDLVLLSI